MKKHVKSILVSSLMALAFGAMSIGSTFALFTSKASTSIEVGSGKLQISSVISGLTTYSAEANSEGDRIDENGAKYISKLTEVQGVFTNKGTASSDGSVLTLSKVTPGDRVTFAVDFGNTSNINYKYRVVYKLLNNDETLAKGLVTKTDLTGTSETHIGLLEYVSPWVLKEANDNAISGISFDIELPIYRGDQYQAKEAVFALTVEAVQGNAYTTDDDAKIVLGTEDFAGEAVAAADQDLVLQATNYEQSATVKTTIPAAANEVEAGDNVELIVSDMEVDYNSSETTSTLAFDITLKVNDAVVSSFSEPVAVEVYVGTGLEIEQVTHNGVVIPASQYTYDPTVGVVRFSTSSFSPFTISYYDIPDAPVRIGKVGYQTLPAAVAASKNGDLIIIQEDLAEQPVSIPADRSITIDGCGHKIEYKQSATGGVPLYLYNAEGALLGGLTRRAAFVVNRGSSLLLKNATVEVEHPSGYTHWCFLNHGGNLVLEDVNASVISSNSYGVVLNNYSKMPTYETVALETSTTIKGSSSLYIENTNSNAVSNTYNSTLVIDGEDVVIEGKFDVIDNQQGAVVLNKGTIRHLGTSSSTYCVKSIKNASLPLPTFTINGGSLISNTGKLFNNFTTIKGGTFDKDPRTVAGDNITITGAVTQTGSVWTVGQANLYAQIEHSNGSIDGYDDSHTVSEIFGLLADGDKLILGSYTYDITAADFANIPNNFVLDGDEQAIIRMVGGNVIATKGFEMKDIFVFGGFAIRGTESEEFVLDGVTFTYSYSYRGTEYFWSGWNYALCVASGNEADVSINDSTLTGYGGRCIELFTENGGSYTATITNSNIQALYPVHNDGQSEITIIIEDTTLTGWNSFDSCTELIMNRVYFAEDDYAVFQPYGKATLTSCVFDECYLNECLGIGSNSVDADLVNCKIEDRALTAEDVVSMVDSGDRATYPSAVWKVNGVSVFGE